MEIADGGQRLSAFMKACQGVRHCKGYSKQVPAEQEVLKFICTLNIFFSVLIGSTKNEEIILKAEDGSYEERKIKDGVRNGTTRYKDANDKTIKMESYKDGVLKE